MWKILNDTLTPFLWGGALALILDIPLRHLEKHLQWLKPKLRRGVALVCIMLGAIVLLGLGIWLLVPQLMQAVNSLSSNWGQLQQEFIQLVGDKGEAVIQQMHHTGAKAMQPLLAAGVEIARGAAQTITQIAIGVVLALYLLAGRESNLARAKRLCLAVFGTPKTQKIQKVAVRSAEVFGQFVVGQCIEASILAGMFLITLLVLGFPYALPISVVIGVTALVPIFGAWIGGGVGFLLICTAGIKKAGWFVVVFILVQELENQVIYPRVVGNRLGLPPLWVLVGVLLGGGILGPTGVFLGIPIIGVLYDLGRQWVHLRLDKTK